MALNHVLFKSASRIRQIRLRPRYTEVDRISAVLRNVYKVDLPAVLRVWTIISKYFLDIISIYYINPRYNIARDYSFLSYTVGHFYSRLVKRRENRKICTFFPLYRLWNRFLALSPVCKHKISGHSRSKLFYRQLLPIRQHFFKVYNTWRSVLVFLPPPPSNLKEVWYLPGEICLRFCGAQVSKLLFIIYNSLK